MLTTRKEESKVSLAHKNKLVKLEKQFSQVPLPLAVTWATALGQPPSPPAEAVTWQSESPEWDKVAFFKIDNEKILAAKVLQNFTTKFKEKLEKKAEDLNAKMNNTASSTMISLPGADKNFDPDDSVSLPAHNKHFADNVHRNH